MLPQVSVIVASHGRPAWLARCLTALGQLDYDNFEVIIAADALGRNAVKAHPHRDHVKLVAADSPNISATRNAGLAQAAGAFVAFIDDDAVPEPFWLRHHVVALETTGADASLGYVRGRNGVSFQSQAASIDTRGETHDETTPTFDPVVPDLSGDRCVKLIGTNCVLHRETLLAVGGFDPAFRFYNDDSDLSLRIAAMGKKAVFVPLAEVHHAYAPSLRRTSRRFPRDLYDIARSTALLRRKHHPNDITAARDALFAEQIKRLERHLVHGTCEPRDIVTAQAQLLRGWQDGMSHALASLPRIMKQSLDFMPFPVINGTHSVLASRLLIRRAATHRRAQAMIEQGQRATVMSFSLTSAPLRVRFMPSGVWLHSGGLYGRAERHGGYVRWCTFTNRVNKEITRVEKQRGIGNNGTRVG